MSMACSPIFGKHYLPTLHNILNENFDTAVIVLFWSLIIFIPSFENQIYAKRVTAAIFSVTIPPVFHKRKFAKAWAVAVVMG